MWWYKSNLLDPNINKLDQLQEFLRHNLLVKDLMLILSICHLADILGLGCRSKTYRQVERTYRPDLWQEFRLCNLLVKTLQQISFVCHLADTLELVYKSKRYR
jgi:hypothetical protein